MAIRCSLTLLSPLISSWERRWILLLCVFIIILLLSRVHFTVLSFPYLVYQRKILQNEHPWLLRLRMLKTFEFFWKVDWVLWNWRAWYKFSKGSVWRTSVWKGELLRWIGQSAESGYGAARKGRQGAECKERGRRQGRCGRRRSEKGCKARRGSQA